MQKVKYYRCPIDNKAFKTLDGFGNHMRKFHPREIPNGWSDARYFYYLQTGKSYGTCIQCGNKTDWNEVTQKYNRFCNNPKCKEQYKAEFQKRMIGKYGKVHLLDDPNQQRKMLASKKMSGKYKFEDKGEVEYTGTYEKDFLFMLDKFMHLSSKDVMGPSPHTYYYFYRNKNDIEHEGTHFYIPDFYIPSLNLEIEIKQNTNTHPKLLAIDHVKELQKDDLMNHIENVNYIKIMEKDYSDFFKYFLDLKESIDVDPDHKPAKIIPIKQSDIEATKDSIATESIMNNDISSVKDIDLFMSNNIKYSNFTKLLSAKEVLDSKKGDCHSQCNLEIYLLNKLNIHGNKLFFIEYNDNESTNAMTHTLVWYKINDKIYWIENAWENMRGIHGPYDSIFNLKDAIVNIHNKMPSSKRYPKLKFASIKYDKIGCSLSEYVSNNLNIDSIATESISYFNNSNNYENIRKISSNIYSANYTKEYIDREIEAISMSGGKYIQEAIDDTKLSLNATCLLYIDHHNIVSSLEIFKMNNGDVIIDHLSTLDEYRNKGYASQLIKTACDKFGADQLKVYKDNPVAIKLYKSLGFVVDNSDTEFYYMKYNKNMSTAIEASFVNDIGTVQFKENNKISSESFLDIFSSYMSLCPENISIATENAIYDTQHKYPVYIVLMHSGTFLANMIKKVTRDDYSHACISFDASMNKIYSFGRKKPDLSDTGFAVSSYQDDFFKNFTAKYGIYVTFVTKHDLMNMKLKLQWFIDHDEELSYDLPALLLNALHLESEHEKKWFCSRFVAEILRNGMELDKKSSLYRPQDLAELDNITLVNSGDDFSKYNYHITKASVDEIMKGDK